ncbi:MAG: lysophospholipase [Bacteroidales bacterium]|nr:lysophospholipase [Bacteroidales bacterium]
MELFSCKASADGLQLAVALIAPDGAPKGIVQLVHGMCEHKERYFDFMEFLAAQGYVAVIHDHRGHGESVLSADDLGYFYDGGWRACVDDVKVVGDLVRKRWPGLPFTLLGHSMGSMVVRCYARRYDDSIDRLIVSGCPSDNPAKAAGALLANIIGVLKGWHYRPIILQKLSFGSYNKPFADEGYRNAWVCSNPEILDRYHDDPLCQFIFTANGFKNLLGMMKDCYSRKGWKMANPGLPVHFISGGEDPCRISDKALEQAADAMRQAGYRQVTLKIYPGMRHEVLNEIGRQQVWDDLAALLP